MTLILFFHAATLTALAAIAALIAFQSRYLNQELAELWKAIMSTQDVVDALVAQLAKVKDEVTKAKQQAALLTDEIASLRVQLDDAQAADAVDLSGLEAIAQELDDLNADDDTEIPTEAEDDEDEDEGDDAAVTPIKGGGDR